MRALLLRVPTTKWLFQILGAWVLASCADSLPVAPLAPLKPSMEAEVVWKEGIGSVEQAILRPVVVQGVLYTANEAGDLRAFEPASGKELWRVKTTESFSAGLGSGEQMLLLGDKKGEVLAYTLKGELLWRSQLSSELMVAPQAAEGVVVTRTADGRITGLSATDGKRRWSVQRPMPALVLRGISQIAMERGAVLVGLPGGKLLALNLADGSVGWEATVSIPKGATELERINDVVGTPLFGFRDVCTASYQGKVACLDVVKGETLWSTDLSVTGALGAEGNKLFATTEKGDVVALNRTSGTVAWKQESLEGRYPSAPQAFGDYVVLGDAQGVVHFLSRADGTELGRIKTDDVAMIQQAQVLDDNLILLTNRDGKLFALAPHGAQSHWLPSWFR